MIYDFCCKIEYLTFKLLIFSHLAMSSQVTLIFRDHFDSIFSIRFNIFRDHLINEQFSFESGLLFLTAATRESSSGSCKTKFMTFIRLTLTNLVKGTLKGYNNSWYPKCL
uniref:Uncharacterized protein n=1 Tax=Cacopsylla melanoneura TaxID=428564 RepID=A0A8D8ZD21_9HEMI